MKTLLILITSLFLFFGCKTTQSPIKEVEIKTQTKIIERLVPVEIPADSAVLMALLECDSLNNVQLKQLNELKTKGIQSHFILKNNQLNYTAKTIHDTVYLPTKEIIIEREEPIYIDVVHEVNKLTGWQNFQLWLGRGLMAFAIVYLAFKRLIK